MTTMFQIGDQVRIVKKHLYTSGKQGMVTGVAGKSITVEIEGVGYFKYHPNSLMFIGRTVGAGDTYSVNYNYNNSSKTNTTKGENNMLMGNYKVCKVKFIEGYNTTKEYTYAYYDDNIAPGDNVVVKSANHGFGLATVTRIVNDEYVTQEMRDYCNEGREIVSKFDMNAYDDRVEKRKAAKKLKVEMDKKLKEVQELAMFEMMAEKNPELKEMLEAYKQLVN